MKREPVEPIAPEAMLGSSDWDDEALLTVVDASERLVAEIKASRERIRRSEEVLDGADSDSPTLGALHAANLAAERKRLNELLHAAQRIKAAQLNAPR